MHKQLLKITKANQNKNGSTQFTAVLWYQEPSESCPKAWERLLVDDRMDITKPTGTFRYFFPILEYKMIEFIKLTCLSVGMYVGLCTLHIQKKYWTKVYEANIFLTYTKFKPNFIFWSERANLTWKWRRE